jgi:hypothetical protein
VDVDWPGLAVDQLDWHWSHQLRPRLVGLSDQEYLWEPVPDCWRVCPAETPTSVALWGSGPFRMEQSEGHPEPAPVTTIAWRIAHLVVEVFGERVHSHFGGPAVTLGSFAFAGTADEALAQLDAAHAAWSEGVRALGAEGMARPCGPAEGPFAAMPLAGLVMHINREVIHHSAEIALLRDLYRHQSGRPLTSP